MPRVLALIALLATLLAALLAAPSAAAAHDLEPTSATADVTIVIGSSLSPRDVRVPAGSVVAWVNRDDERHRMRSRSGPARFDSEDLEPGERFAVRLTSAGTYGYADDRERDDASYHGTVVVTAASTPASGGDDPPATGGGGGASSGGGSTSAPASVAASIGDRVFAPSSITVAVGGSVTWTNDDDREHTVTASGGAFDSGVLGQGGTFREAFDTAGAFPFLCAIHPEMQGEVVVVGSVGGSTSPTPAPTAAPTPTAAPAAPAPSAPASTGTDDADPAPAVVTIEMRDFAFGPTSAVVTDGGAVTFANVGAAPHTATSAAGGFDTEMVASGTTTTVTVGRPGTYAFSCAFHPEMRGEIEVVAASTGPAAAPAVTDAPASASPGATAVPSPTTAAAAASPTASPTNPAPAIASTGDATPTAAASDGLGGMVGLLVGVTLIAIAVALFARTIGGTVRRAE